MLSTKKWTDKLLTCQDIPYHHQGSSRYGCDCIGLPILASKELGYDYTEFDVPNRLPDANDDTLVNLVAKVCREIPDPKIGSLIVIRLPEWHHYRHCGIRTGEDEFIHADRDAGKVCLIPFRSAYTRSGLVRFFEMPFLCL